MTTGPGLRARLLPRRPLSLRARLLWAFLVPLVVVLAVVGFAATAALRAEQLTQVDSQLRAAVFRSAQADHGPDDDHPPGSFGGLDFLAARGQGNGTRRNVFSSSVRHKSRR